MESPAYGSSPLHSAVRNGRWDVVRALLAACALARVAVVNSGWSRTGLLVDALCAMRESPDLSMVATLLAAGADVSDATCRDQAALHVAAELLFEEVVPVLLAAGAAVNAADYRGWTPLHGVCSTTVRVRDGDVSRPQPAVVVARALLAAGADPARRDTGGCTPLALAVEHRRSELVELLLAQPTAGVCIVALYAAATTGNVEAMSAMLAHTSPTGCGDVRPRVSHGDRVCAADARPPSPVPAGDACASGGPGRFTLSRTQADDLLNAAASQEDVHVPMLAYPAGLWATGCTGKLTCMRGQHALTLAIRSDGASDKDPSGAGASAARALLGSIRGRAHVRLSSGGYSVTRDATPLRAAVQAGNADLVRALRVAGAVVNSSDEDGVEPLHMAVLTGRVAVVEALLTDVSVEASPPGDNHVSVGAGVRAFPPANVYARTHKGATAMLLAVKHDHEAIAHLLLAAGSDPLADNTSGMTPLHVAARRERRDLVLSMMAVARERAAPSLEALAVRLPNLRRLGLPQVKQTDEGVTMAPGVTPLAAATAAALFPFDPHLQQYGSLTCALDEAVSGGHIDLYEELLSQTLLPMQSAR